ncbi:unnamed protein product [Psylliodes chrysocephalus]|uniref:Uncharacterized protein n=1 Tax=Psylliodes chrysocephalus TaxID=3402493 RepID=A0A9P0CL15_9CUCU|nr:unnamed protein product [Psylliodes chrysocephala]
MGGVRVMVPSLHHTGGCCRRDGGSGCMLMPQYCRPGRGREPSRVLQLGGAPTHSHTEVHAEYAPTRTRSRTARGTLRSCKTISYSKSVRSDSSVATVCGLHPGVSSLTLAMYTYLKLKAKINLNYN